VNQYLDAGFAQFSGLNVTYSQVHLKSHRLRVGLNVRFNLELEIHFSPVPSVRPFREGIRDVFHDQSREEIKLTRSNTLERH
jgi:hypothetical protein